MTSALLAAPLVLAAVLALAATAKWRHRDSLVSATRLLRLPGWLEGPVRLLPPIELALAVALVLLPWAPAFAVAAAGTLGLMLAYLAVVARGLTLTPRPSCGCFGRVGAPITVSTLARNVVLSALGAAALAWGLGGHTVPTALVAADATTWGWLLALVAAAAVTVWVVHERAGQPRPAPTASPAPAAATDADEGDLDYVREPIPPLMLAQDGTPVTLRALAHHRAQLLVWVTCGCGSNQEAVRLADGWREASPLLDVRLVSTMNEDATRQIYPGEREWLWDPSAGAFSSLGLTSNPAAVLLGADGLLAGGPVAGLDDVRDLGEAIVEQLADVVPEPSAEPV